MLQFSSSGVTCTALCGTSGQWFLMPSAAAAYLNKILRLPFPRHQVVVAALWRWAAAVLGLGDVLVQKFSSLRLPSHAHLAANL